MAGLNFDPVARIYSLLERMVFGRSLERCRTSLLPTLRPMLQPGRRALFIGEGDGRFLQQFLERFPDASVDVVESSGEMIQIARKRAGNPKNVRFLRYDILTMRLPEAGYDLIVTHFVLDLFSTEDIDRLVSEVLRLAPDAGWLLSEFRVCPDTPIARWASLWMLGTMYRFFRITAGLKTRRLPDYATVFARHGLACRARREFWRGFIVAEFWSGKNLVGDDAGHVR